MEWRLFYYTPVWEICQFHAKNKNPAQLREIFGWGGRIRTDECQSQSLVPYRLATAQNIMGWNMGLEPMVSSATNWRVNQLRYIHHFFATLFILQQIGGICQLFFAIL